MATEETELQIESGDTYTLTLDPDGGFIEDEEHIGYKNHQYLTTRLYRKKVRYNETVGELPIPKRPGYEFVGWFRTFQGFWYQMEEYPYKQQVELKDNDFYAWKRSVIFTARWRGVHIICLTWNANGGRIYDHTDPGQDPAIATETATYGEVLEHTTYFRNSMYAPHRYGYEFIGWFTHPTQGIQVDEYTPLENVTTRKEDGRVYYYAEYFAHWRLKQYEVKFVDGEDILETRTLTHGQSIGRMPSLGKLGYVFDGWWAEDVQHTEEFVPNSDLTLQAHWTLI